jgi:hypothetical protein
LATGIRRRTSIGLSGRSHDDHHPAGHDLSSDNHRSDDDDRSHHHDRVDHHDHRANYDNRRAHDDDHGSGCDDDDHRPAEDRPTEDRPTDHDHDCTADAHDGADLHSRSRPAGHAWRRGR